METGSTATRQAADVTDGQGDERYDGVVELVKLGRRASGRAPATARRGQPGRTRRLSGK
jgi:hypothetical protein